MAMDQDAPLSITIEQALKQQCADGTFIRESKSVQRVVRKKMGPEGMIDCSWEAKIES